LKGLLGEKKMATSRTHLFDLMAAFIAVLMAVFSLKDLMLSLAGLTILVALFAYDQRGNRSGLQSLAFAFVCGLALYEIVSYPLRVVLPSLPGMLPGFVANEFPAIVWVIATAAFWFIDRARIDARQLVQFGSYAQPQVSRIAPQRAFVSNPVPAVPVEPMGTWTVPAPEPVAEPVAVSAPNVTPAEMPEPVQVAQPAPTPPPRSGKEVSIYVNMLDEGMNVLRAVRAEHLGRDFYLIVDEMPADEKWEYAPGQVVRCHKKNLSGGKGLVAYEEAPRSQ
jgi:hypothetical protein